MIRTTDPNRLTTADKLSLFASTFVDWLRTHVATQSKAGMMSASDKIALDNLVADTSYPAPRLVMTKEGKLYVSGNILPTDTIVLGRYANIEGKFASSFKKGWKIPTFRLYTYDDGTFNFKKMYKGENVLIKEWDESKKGWRLRYHDGGLDSEGNPNIRGAIRDIKDLVQELESYNDAIQNQGNTVTQHGTVVHKGKHKRCNIVNKVMGIAVFRNGKQVSEWIPFRFVEINEDGSVEGYTLARVRLK